LDKGEPVTWAEVVAFIDRRELGTSLAENILHISIAVVIGWDWFF
jgi:hypothetical protein